MFYEVDKHSGIPSYIQIMNQIKKEIIIGNLKKGDSLPPVRELSKIFKVNVNTILRALEKLELEGYLEAQHGVGFFISTNIDLRTSIFNEVSNFVEKMKKENLDLETVKLLLEEAWKNGQFSE
ncbi:GntR family transcriptional regulator [Petrotoga sp. 9PWA.NaAc.5.4]|uniref:GntR family transcriptional regulator n=1 Tax=Petrotoga sp. 9PWA.NaAc.5.4 TaxID=1434328 RepID=UPI000CABC0D0|nr:GntR family transcriptional regulator [Petrotoga sp. 9PWA.NaAc.5.4]PNR94844.1 transcriptional regulator [Petrotoga sp. 9PWA.NaAc.5.4]